MVNIKEYYKEFLSKESLCVLSINYDREDINIILLDENNKKIRFVFEWARSISVIDKNVILKQYKNLVIGLYQLKKSEYLEWFHLHNFETLRGWNVKHYLLVTSYINVSIISYGDEKIHLSFID